MKKPRQKIGLIFGTRPEIVKLAPLVRLLEKKKADYFTLHTGQHYSFEMDRLFFRQLQLPAPRYKLVSSGSGQHGEQTGHMLENIEKILLKEKPGAVLVQGDTNSVLAGALAASKIAGIRIGHVEAGLRSYDRRMPEELNRSVTDHLSDFLFAPTPAARRILVGEGVASKKIFVTGNTIVDSVLLGLKLARKKAKLQKILPARVKKFFLLTLHRQENVDDRKIFGSILSGLEKIHQLYGTPILFPAHPRTVKMIRRFGLRVPRGIHVLKPVGFMEFLLLEKSAELLLTDSGGVQEEGCILRVPCVTLRTTTERPETVRVGANVIAGHEPEKIVRSARRMLRARRDWANPFGDGRASTRILNIVERALA